MSRRGVRAHVLRAEAEPAHYAPLLTALAGAGLRAGWLDLRAAPEPPEALAAAAELDVLRAVAVGGGRAVSSKAIRGEPVLRDLLREHFSGCDVVLVRGDVDAVELAPLSAQGDGWRITDAAGDRDRSTDQIVARLRSPKPLARPAGKAG